MRALAARVRRGLALVSQVEFSPMSPPWARRETGTVPDLRRVARLSAARLMPSRPHRVLFFGVSVLWPLLSFVDAMICVSRLGGAVTRDARIGRLRQVQLALARAWRDNYRPFTFYMYRLWSPATTATATQFLQDQELAVLQMILNRDLNTRVLWDKRLFAATCQSAGIPTPPIVATIAPGEPESWPSGGEGVLPAQDLFMKWIDGERGLGAERWVYDQAARGWRRRDGRPLDAAALLDYARSRGRQRGLLVQTCLSNHRDLSGFSTSALCTVRVMTYRDEDASPVVIGAALRMPVDAADVDNMNAGGLAAAVDLETGRLRAARAKDVNAGAVSRHPVSGAAIEGVQLAILADAIALGVRAHSLLPVPWSVGWDVAMTPDGPVLVEGNPLWGAGLYHIAYGAPFPDHFVTRLLARARGAVA